MAKWFFYVLVFIYMCYRAVYGVKSFDTGISVESINYDETGFLPVGTRKTVYCRAPLKNQKLEWIDPSGNVVKRIPTNGVYVQEHLVTTARGSRSPGVVLTFSQLRVNDSGVYQCRSGDQKKSVRVCVIKPAEFVDSVDTPTEVIIEVGRSISLACQANGDPEPKIVWTRNEDEINEGEEHPKYKVNRRYKMQGYESLLTITSVEPEDAGLYQCWAVQESAMLDNCTTSEVRNVTLRVEHEPTFQNNKEVEYVYGKYGEVVPITCEASGHPKPTYRWFKDNGKGKLDEFDKAQIIFSEDPNTATLPVTAGPTTYENTYKCTAKNKFGESEKYFQLKKREKPRQPDHISPVLISSNRVLFNVSWDDEVTFPVDRLRIEYAAPHARPRQVLKIIADEDNEIETETGILVELVGLKPLAKYVARIRAENAAGEGPWSDEEFFTTISQAEAETEEESSEETEDEGDEKDELVKAQSGSDGGLFYGIFFTAGILIVVVVCMIFMRMV